jgi:hypothetical protein
MDILKEFPSAYLKAVDFPNPQTETIDKVLREVVGQEREHKPVLYLDGVDRGIVLNKTNATMLAHMHGADTTTWKGKRVQVYIEAVAFQGKIVDSIRLREVPAEEVAADAPF